MTSLRDRIHAKREQTAAAKASGTKTYKFKVGTTLFRILPDKKNADNDPWRDFGQHFIKDENGNMLAVIGDRSIITGGAENCPVRDALLSATKGAPQELKDHIYQCLAKTQSLVNVQIIGLVKDRKLVADPDAPSDTPQLVAFTQNQFDDILSIVELYMDNGEDVFDPENGITFVAERVGTTQKDTKYKFNAYPKKFPIKQEVLDKAHDLDAWINATLKDGAARALEAVGEITGSIAGPIGEAAAALTGGTSKPKLIESTVDEDPTDSADEIVIEDGDFEEVETSLATTPPATTATKAKTTAVADDADIMEILEGLS